MLNTESQTSIFFLFQFAPQRLHTENRLLTENTRNYVGRWLVFVTRTYLHPVVVDLILLRCIAAVLYQKRVFRQETTPGTVDTDKVFVRNNLWSTSDIFLVKILRLRNIKLAYFHLSNKNVFFLRILLVLYDIWNISLGWPRNVSLIFTAGGVANVDEFVL